MSTIQEPSALAEWENGPFPEGRFTEAESDRTGESAPTPLGFLPWAEASWAENLNPFAETELEGTPTGEAELRLAEAFAELRDEAFDEAVGNLVAETEDVIGHRFADESSTTAGPEKERLGGAHLSPIQFEAEQYLDRLTDGLAGLDVESLDETSLNEMLDRFDPEAAPLSPAGEEFLGSLIRKAKSAVKFVAKTARRVGKAAGGLLTGALKRLRKLVAPLLRRVLSFAIGRLPAPLRAPARLLAGRIFTEQESAGEAEAAEEDFASSPAQATDTEALSESFDAALAEAMVGDEAITAELEALTGDEYEQEGPLESHELELLAEARAKLIDTLAAAGDGEDLGPAVEQFVPALLGALRLGINLVGRPRVVGFLARYLARLIGRWVGPTLSGPLSSAIVDTGLRLISLEQPEFEREGEAVPALLAATVEDTVRRLAENEDYIFENEDLMQLATVEAFERSVATNFPPSLVRRGLPSASSIAGRFVTRRPRSARPYRRFSRMPEVEISASVAERITSFGGVTLGATLRAAGAGFPLRARLHIFEATIGTSLRRIAALERGRLGGSRASSTQLHPLTPTAAGLLLNEPALGVRVGAAFLQSRARVAAGQRFYYLEPIAGGAPTVTPVAARSGTPSQGWIVADTIRSRIVVALYFSETDAQTIAAGVRAGRPAAALLPALTAAYDGVARSFGTPSGRVRIVKETVAGEEFFGSVAGRLLPLVITQLRRVIRSWLLPLLATWMRERSAEFGRASASPGNGVTITATLSGVPGMSVLRDALNGKLGLGTLHTVASGAAFTGTPAGVVTVQAGVRRP